MKWIRFAGAVVTTLGLTTAAHAGLLDLFEHHGSSKSCGCAPCCQPKCCAPTITKPCCPTVHTYQRKISDKKPPCCNTCCAPKSCCPKSCCPKSCCPKPCAPKCCAPPPAKCAAPAQPCAPPKGQCCAPAPAKCCAPPKNCCPKSCCPKSCCPKSCCQQNCCQQSCCKQRCCNADPCEIAQLIYQSQTACYAKDRRKAIEELGDNYDCVCNPEIMVAFIYALNDADERVRAEAADEIGDQLRKNPCCCSKEVVAALTAALGDCDKKVRRQAEEALEECGYEVVDGCCDGVCCDPCCKQGGCTHGAPAAPTPADDKKGAAPPAPGTAGKVYFPARLRHVGKPRRSRLSNLFGLLD